jgi:hypothetical protein
MNRTITRKIVFTADEVKDALINYLEKNSQKAPLTTDDSTSFELNEFGAVLEWTDANALDLS